MSFRFGNQSAASNNSNNSGDNGQSGGYEKAAGFLNFYLPNKEGQQSKLGAIPLRVGNPKEKALLEQLSKAPEETVKKLIAKLVIDFRTTEPKPGNEFALD